MLGLGGHSEEVARERLFDARRRRCSRTSACRARWPTAGIDAEAYRAALPELVRDAFRDASLRTNPRMPLLEELGALFQKAS